MNHSAAFEASKYQLPGADGPTVTPRIFEAICEEVRTQLSLGHLKPGDKLPAERELALQFGRSRTAVREALRTLEMAGVIELRKGVKGGAFIREGDPAVVTRSFGDMVHLGHISLENLTESRVIIQDAVIRLACKRGSDADFDALDENIALTAQLTRQKRWEERRVQLVGFYRLLAQATRNAVMVILVDALTDIVLEVIAREGAAPKEDTVKAQRAMVKALRKRDADQAAALMVRHLKALHGHLFNAAAKRSRAARVTELDAGRARSAAGASLSKVLANAGRAAAGHGANGPERRGKSTAPAGRAASAKSAFVKGSKASTTSSGVEAPARQDRAAVKRPKAAPLNAAPAGLREQAGPVARRGVARAGANAPLKRVAAAPVKTSRRAAAKSTGSAAATTSVPATAKTSVRAGATLSARPAVKSPAASPAAKAAGTSAPAGKAASRRR